jgi:hypothetical protein
VRARVEGHIQAVFPDAQVTTTVSADYRYRTRLPRKVVAAAVSKMAQSIDYDNFKNSVSDQWLHNSYLGVWQVMRSLQDKVTRRRWSCND